MADGGLVHLDARGATRLRTPTSLKSEEVTKMFRWIRLPALIAVAAAPLLLPVTSLADDHHDRGDRDDYYGRSYYGDRHADHEYREHRRHEEHEWREHEWREHERRENRYRNGYYDQYGYWHPYAYNGY